MFADSIDYRLTALLACFLFGLTLAIVRPAAGTTGEPYRVFRRLLILEGWSHDQAHTPVFS